MSSQNFNFHNPQQTSLNTVAGLGLIIFLRDIYIYVARKNACMEEGFHMGKYSYEKNIHRKKNTQKKTHLKKKYRNN